MTSLYVHITPKENTEEIIKSWVIDTSSLGTDKRYAWANFHGQFWRRVLPVKAFLYDALKVQQDQWTRNLPWVWTKGHMKTMFFGMKLWIIPYFVHCFKVELYDALVFEANINPKHIVENYATVEGVDRKIYTETAVSERVVMQNPEIVDIHEICEDLFWMEAPYITYKFPESNDRYYWRKFTVDSQTYIEEL